MLILFASLCSSDGGLQGADEPGAVAKQPASCQDGFSFDDPLYSPSRVRYVSDCQVLCDSIHISNKHQQQHIRFISDFC